MAFEVQWRCNGMPNGALAPDNIVNEIGQWRSSKAHRHVTLDEAREDLAYLVVANAEAMNGKSIREPCICVALRVRALQAVPGEDVCPLLRFSHRIVETDAPELSDWIINPRKD